MLRITGNKLKTNGILIGEEVYLRIAFTTRFGETDPQEADNILAWLQYKAFTKAAFEESNLKANSFRIDGIKSEIVKSISKTENHGWQEFNQLFKDYIIAELSLAETDIEIIDL